MEPTSKIIQDGITFDDVLLVPSYSEITPELADTRTALTRNISLNIPLISAPMDTVTLSSLAIALAQEGGIGIIHKNLPAERQAREVARVKRSENGVIADPVTLSPEDSVERAMIQMSEQGVSGFPVTTDGTSRGRVVGILTRRDMTFLHADDSTARVGDVMTRENLITAPADVKSERAEELMTRSRVEKLLLLDGTGSLAGLMTMRDLENVRNHPQACRDERGRLRVGAAIGPHQFERAHALIEAEVDVLVVDTAHGHSKNVIDTVRRLKSECSIDVIAGNVATGDGARALIDAGADGVKIGIGPGSICTTRVVTGVGVPQITAIMNAVEVASSEQVPIIADGGIRMSGDIAKAIASGASSVMLGSLFAGLDESPGELILHRGRRFKSYRGMGSSGAMGEGSADRYGQAGVRDTTKFVPEGVEGMVPYRGALSDVVYQMVGGIRSAMGYCGCTDMEAFRANARFVRVTAASMVESHPHDITITKEAPNYSASNATGGGFES
ncbi:MAG: IMP dehydrogenase [Phycisphaerales bacterium]|jgi:IMP dehydrogenase|nr:IMP dehydrogenase [Phycisphaerales bacterium]